MSSGTCKPLPAHGDHQSPAAAVTSQSPVVWSAQSSLRGINDNGEIERLSRLHTAGGADLTRGQKQSRKKGPGLGKMFGIFPGHIPVALADGDTLAPFPWDGRRASLSNDLRTWHARARGAR